VLVRQQDSHTTPRTSVQGGVVPFGREVSVSSYQLFNAPLQGITTIQGVRQIRGTTERVIISGSLKTPGGMTGLVYEGPLDNSGSWHELTYTAAGVDDVTTTSCYGPDWITRDTVRVVGSWKRASVDGSMGFLYEGTLGGSGVWENVTPSADAKNTYVHSTMGGYAVGNYDTRDWNGFAFLYDIGAASCTPIAYPSAYSTTCYGIWQNAADHYTLVGGYAQLQGDTISHGWMCDFSPADGFTNWTSFSYMDAAGNAAITHFEGIDGTTAGRYSISCNFGGTATAGAALLTITRNAAGAFVHPQWTPYTYPSASLTTNDCVVGTTCLGICVIDDVPSSYAATLTPVTE